MQHVTKDILTTKEATKGSGVFDHELRALCTAMLKSLRTLRKFFGGPSLSKRGFARAKTPRTPSSEVVISTEGRNLS